MKAIIASVCLLSFFSYSSFGGAPVLWDVPSGGNGHYYQTVFVTNGITWAAANAAANAAGGYLCTITSAEENVFVANLIQNDTNLFSYAFGTTCGPWIGGVQTNGAPEPDGGWTWGTGEPWSFTAWANGEPNDNGDEDRVMFYEDYETTYITNWNDANHDTSLNGYVIEYDSVPTIAAIRFSEAEISWQSVSNTLYRVEYSSDLTTNFWTTLSNSISGDGTVLRVTDKIPVGESRRFYRVRALLTP